MTLDKRLFDIICALGLSIILAPLILWVTGLVLLKQGRPILYRSERMKTPTDGFLLWKFRTMTAAEGDSGVSGGDKTARITPMGAFLRRYRLDELPQLWNILRGDISFVGPRPPLRRYVVLHPELYQEVLKARPGITGLATLAYHRTEERLLSQTTTAAETEDVYRRRCVPRKARLDLIYARDHNLCRDFRIMCATVFRRINLHGPDRQ